MISSLRSSNFIFFSRVGDSVLDNSNRCSYCYWLSISCGFAILVGSSTSSSRMGSGSANPFFLDSMTNVYSGFSISVVTTKSWLGWSSADFLLCADVSSGANRCSYPKVLLSIRLRLLGVVLAPDSAAACKALVLALIIEALNDLAADELVEFGLLETKCLLAFVNGIFLRLKSALTISSAVLLILSPSNSHMLSSSEAISRLLLMPARVYYSFTFFSAGFLFSLPHRLQQ